MDSLDLVELAQIVEDDYGVQLKGEDMEGLKTVRQAVDLVARSWDDPLTSSSRASAPSRRSASAPAPCTSAGAPARPGIEDGFGRCARVRAQGAPVIKEMRRADRFTQLALAAAAGGHRATRAGTTASRPCDPDRAGCDDRHRHRRASGRSRQQHLVLQRAGRRADLAALDPAADGERGVRRGSDEARPAGPVVRDRVRLRGGRPRDRHGRPADPLRRRRRGRDRRQRGRA